MSYPWLERFPVRRYVSLVRRDLVATYSRDLSKWLIVGPLIGVVTGLVITALAAIILQGVWPPLLRAYLHHHWTILPGLVGGFVVTGLIMQFLTPDPNQHSTEEIIHSYHHEAGRVDMRPFFPKLLASITTVGFGGSAALEGPSIYGGGAVGSWLWARLRRVGLQDHDRRIMLISGAAAGMAAVFRAPLTGLVFALEMPYKDDLAHEALLPSLIASVVSYVTLISFMGSGALFDFPRGPGFSGQDLLWSALLGLICGGVVLVFDVTFRRFHNYARRLAWPHWLKLAIGGLLTGLCGWAFVALFPGPLIPLGPNYEAVGNILLNPHLTIELLIFVVLKLAASLFSLGSGGVSALFVPLFLSGGALGKAFGQSLAHAPSPDLFAAVGMAAFIAGGYKTPLTAVVFVAEATGGHAYIIPTLIGAAVAYAVSGTASVSGDQRWHESDGIQKLSRVRVRDAMQTRAITVPAASTIEEFAARIALHQAHIAYPVLDEQRLLGTVSVWVLNEIPREKWAQTRIAEVTERSAPRLAPEADVMEALRLLTGAPHPHLALVSTREGRLEGVLTKTDILAALREPPPHPAAPPAESSPRSRDS